MHAVVAPEHAQSGSPYGPVVFLIDGVDVGKKELPYSPLSPGPVPVTLQSTKTVAAGHHTLSARFDGDPVPTSVTGLDGFTTNPFKGSVDSTSFVVERSPTTTSLSHPAFEKHLVTILALVVNDPKVTGGPWVDPGVTVELWLDGKTRVDTSETQPHEATLTLTAAVPPGRHVLVAKFLGNANELPSSSRPFEVEVTAN
jgi:hypothetical protein